jgi:hypothetical protein
MEGKPGRSGHYIKKKSKDQKKFTSDEREHTEMLRVAKKLQSLDNNELDGIDHRIASSEQDELKSSLEGLSEREVRILVQDEFIPSNNKENQYKKFSIQTNIQSGSGLADITLLTPDSPLKVHDNVIAKIPIAPTTTEQLIRQSKVAAASGDLFMTGRDFIFKKIKKKKCFFFIE